MMKKVLISLFGFCCSSVFAVELSIDELKQLAEQGNDKAQVELAQDYLEGWKNLQKDPVKSHYWYMKAAEQGNTSAEVNVGLNYVQGTTPEKNIDYKKGMYWINKAAKEGDDSAQTNLCWYHIHRFPFTNAPEKIDYKSAYIWGMTSKNNGGIQNDSCIDEANARLSTQDLREAQGIIKLYGKKYKSENLG